MGYIKTDWLNKNSSGSIASGAPALSANNLNKMEDGIQKSFNKDVGFISFYCNTEAPEGWLVCDGSAISRTIYADLFKCIGTKFGSGDGETTFNLPDLRGEFIRGWNNESSGKDANREFGTKQEATRFTTSDYGARYLRDGEDSATVNTRDGGRYTEGMTTGAIRVRPNNIALLPCIYTGVFND